MDSWLRGPIVLRITNLSNMTPSAFNTDACISRWVPKLVDGIKFGIDYPVVAEIEEDRWAAEASNLQV